MIKHYDLFAGIGGFSYALDTVFYDQEIKHIFCEWEAFPTEVLKKHWQDATYYGDIADLVADTKGWRWNVGSRTNSKTNGNWVEGDSEKRNTERCKSGRCGEITILTGGFPCQPFSHAGRRQGTSDDRYKWPEMFAVIQNVRPDWVIAENVRGLVTWNDGMVLETVCADLESEGYEVQPLIIPACAVGAPHRRDRVWIVAYSQNTNGRGKLRNIFSKDAEEYKPEEQYKNPAREFSDASINASNTGCRNGIEGSETVRPERLQCEPENSKRTGWEWNRDWRKVALTTCHDGVDDGLPRWMDGVTISAARHRKERLKACGNAIVPQVAIEIFKSIKHAP